MICHGIERMPPLAFEESCEIMAAITRPAISSNNAALINTEPTLVALISTSNNATVVPSEVEHSAAPAAKACSAE
jgi:hypothetical protein